jgi:hypothetical protein
MKVEYVRRVLFSSKILGLGIKVPSDEKVNSTPIGSEEE